MNAKDKFKLVNSKRKLFTNTLAERPENNPKLYENVILNKFKHSQATTKEKTERLLNTFNQKSNHNENFLDSDDEVYTSKSNSSSSSYDSNSEESSHINESENESKLENNKSFKSFDDSSKIKEEILSSEIISEKDLKKDDISKKIDSQKFVDQINPQSEKLFNKEPKTFREWMEKNKSQNKYYTDESEYEENSEDSGSSYNSSYSSKISNKKKNSNNFPQDDSNNSKNSINSADITKGKKTINGNEKVNGNGGNVRSQEDINIENFDNENSKDFHNNLTKKIFYGDDKQNNLNQPSIGEIKNNENKNKYTSPLNFEIRDKKNIFHNNKLISSIKANTKKKEDYASFIFSDDKYLFNNENSLDCERQEKSKKNEKKIIEEIPINNSIENKNIKKNNSSINSNLSNFKSPNKNEVKKDQEKKIKKSDKLNLLKTENEDSFKESPIKQTNLLHRKNRKLKELDEIKFDNSKFFNSDKNSNYYNIIVNRKNYKSNTELEKNIFKSRDIIEPEIKEIKREYKTFANGRYSRRNRPPKINPLFGERLVYKADENGLIELKQIYTSSSILNKIMKDVKIEKPQKQKKRKIKKKKEELSEIEEDSSESEKNNSIFKDKRLNEFEENFKKKKFK